MCLVEIKGTTTGAKEAAVSQLQRHAMKYVVDTNVVPTRLWLIVNQFREKHPGARTAPLGSAQGLVDEFAKSGGLVFDTAQLLELVLEVEKGSRTPDDVRELLWSVTGRLGDPPMPSELRSDGVTVDSGVPD